MRDGALFGSTVLCSDRWRNLPEKAKKYRALLHELAVEKTRGTTPQPPQQRHGLCLIRTLSVGRIVQDRAVDGR